MHRVEAVRDGMAEDQWWLLEGDDEQPKAGLHPSEPIPLVIGRLRAYVHLDIARVFPEELSGGGFE